MTMHLTEEQIALQRTVRDFTDREIVPVADQMDETEEFPTVLLEKLRELGLLGIGIDPKYGGAGGGSTEAIITMEQICRGYAGLGTIFAVQIGLFGQSIQRFASDQQKAAYLPRLTQGNLIGAYALTEPNAGSDAAAIETTASRKGSAYVLNGQKTFISCAERATHFLIVATLDRKLRDKGITCFVVPATARGLTTRMQKGKIGIRASTTAEVFMQDVEVTAENRIGDDGAGFKIVMQVLEGSRLQVGAQACGIGQCALDASLAWVQQRKTFGVPLAQHQGIQFMLADMATRLEAARLLTYQAAQLRDAGKPFSKEGAMAKLFAAEAAMWIATKAMQILGGYSYFKGSTVERCFRDAKITEIYEGTSEVQRMVIARRLLSGNR